jgi:nucleoid-associated protein YgaU
MGFDAWDLGAEADGKVVTLTGTARTLEVKTLIMMEFNKLVDTDNTLNMIGLAEPPRPEPPAEEPTVAFDSVEPQETVNIDIAPDGSRVDEGTVIYEVVAGDTLGAIAQRFYGKSSRYMKIFEANRDILDNPDLIKVGQKLKIPKE